ncbi:Catalytic domain of components of various dehydrogenase complexes [Laribacter hongkongensis HLHK9]|uniref:Dihydrolipoamide acetyltransferase component of pyruvate dehydrogenase complex n=1 Tax=Laribacter hongkongensis (strain HLHK9) TaxID=557598 RepID=C1DAD8_LARHH|nr:dihydrolipoamide acetyltransferase family protein [Laribacter hongkongensis]ACO75253.1 Catalytic domain of components of various dehydrogenase complexes [Laribacter hongkongensis HLHK9]
MKTFCLPDLGEGLQEAEIVAWHVGEGSRVVLDQPLLSVETAKAIVDVPAPFAGLVMRCHAGVGDIVPLGAPLVDIDEDAGCNDSGTVVGHVEPARPAAGAAASGVVFERKTAPDGGVVRAMPAARLLAARLGVELSAVTGSGPDGVIVLADVEVQAGRQAPAPVAAPSVAEPPEHYERIRGPRRAMAQSMSRAHADVAAVTLVEDADIDAWPAGSDTTLRLIRAIVAACRAVPVLNGWFDAASLSFRRRDTIDLGVALDMDDALFVPVLRDVGARSEADLRAGIEAMKRDVKNRSLAPEELRGHSITLSNFGMVAGRYASPVIVPPTVCIVGAGRIRPQPVAVGESVGVHRVLPVSLTFDHRAATGMEAARFLRVLVADLQAG